MLPARDYVGGNGRLPSVDDILKMFTALTGKEPDLDDSEVQADIAMAEVILAAAEAKSDSVDESLRELDDADDEPIH